jgi:hypothetical protein
MNLTPYFKSFNQLPLPTPITVTAQRPCCTVVP